VYLKDIWPSTEEIKSVMAAALTPEMFRSRYSNVFSGTADWQKIETVDSKTYAWEGDSTYVQNPPFFEGMGVEVNGGGIADIQGARPWPCWGTASPLTTFPPPGRLKPTAPPAAT
jgi:aconitate hydratase